MAGLEALELSLALVGRHWGTGFPGENCIWEIWGRGHRCWCAVAQVSGGGGGRGRAVPVCLACGVALAKANSEPLL